MTPEAPSDAFAEFRSFLDDLLGPEHVPRLLEFSEMVRTGKGDILVHDQGPTDSLYFLLEGALALSVEVNGHSILLGSVQAGNWVGEVALFSESERSISTVEAIADSVLLRVTFDQFFALAQSAPATACHLAHGMIGMLIQRLRATVNDPILDPEGQLLMLGNMSLPIDELTPHHGVRDFFKSLLGVH